MEIRHITYYVMCVYFSQQSACRGLVGRYQTSTYTL